MTTLTATRPSYLSLVRSRVVAETRIFFRERDSLIFVFFFPLLFLLLFAALLGGENITPEGSPAGAVLTFKQYFLPGMIASGFAFTGFQNLAIAIPVERDQGILKRLRGTPLPASAYFLGKVGQVLVISTAQIVMMLVVARYALNIPMPTEASAWLTLTWVFFLGLAMCTVLGIAMSSVPRTGKSASAVVVPIVLVLQFISGVYFNFSSIPSWMQHVAEVFPLKWMAQSLRSVFLPGYMEHAEPRQSWELGTSAIVMGAWLVVGLFLALRTFRWQSRKDG
jgi:ABC-2 type transport system permease protein